MTRLEEIIALSDDDVSKMTVLELAEEDSKLKEEETVVTLENNDCESPIEDDTSMEDDELVVFSDRELSRKELDSS